MTHARREILDFALGRLTGLSTTGANAWHFGAHPHPLEGAELPGLRLVDQGDSSIEVTCIGYPRDEHRTFDVVIEALAAEVAGVHDVLQAIETEVELALNASKAVNTANAKLVDGFQKVASQVTYSNTADRPAARLEITFRATYRVLSNDPGTALG
jgi:hypothetical protein